MTEWLFAAPWWLISLIALVGIGVFIEGNRRTSQPMRKVGVGIFIFAVALFTLARWVDTDQKKVDRATHRLVEAVRQQQWDAVSGLLEPDAILSLSGIGPLNRSAAEIVNIAKLALTQRPLSSASFQSLTLVQNSRGEFTATMTIICSSDALAGQPVPSTWKIDWVKDDGHWKVHEIDAIDVAGRSGTDIEHELLSK